jgi:hypothetical protein
MALREGTGGKGQQGKLLHQEKKKENGQGARGLCFIVIF